DRVAILAYVVEVRKQEALRVAHEESELVIEVEVERARIRRLAAFEMRRLIDRAVREARAAVEHVVDRQLLATHAEVQPECIGDLPRVRQVQRLRARIARGLQAEQKA